MTQAEPLPTEESHDSLRIARGRVIASTPDAIAKATDKTYLVKSQTGLGTYRVELLDDASSCNCPDFIKNDGRLECKHIAATRFYLEAQTTHSDGTVTSERVRLTYGQAWHVYTLAQENNHWLFNQILSELVSDVADPRPPKPTGRPRTPFSDVLFCAVEKVDRKETFRQAQSLFGEAVERKQITRRPSFTVPSTFLSRADVTPVLNDLIAKVSMPMASMEDSFAVDSSGFRTTTFGSYCQERHGRSKVNLWLKAHVIAGTKTHVIPKVIITEGNGADSPQFPGLVKGIIDAGFVVKEVYGDKGYLSKENYNTAAAVGATAYIAFKENSRATRRGGSGTPSPLWRKMFHLFQADPEGFNSHYRKRENVESVFSAIKKKLGETLNSRDPTAQVNELLCKVLAYDITVLIHEMYEHRVVPDFATRAAGMASTKAV